MTSRRFTTRLLLAAVAILLVLRYAAGVSWGARAAGALLVLTVVFRFGFAGLRPLQPERRAPAVDVVEESGVPVYSCPECGTQLVLLRKGKDRPPRHCGEPMAFTLVQPADDIDLTTIPDYPPDDLDTR